MKSRKIITKLIICCIILGLLGIVTLLYINWRVKSSVSDRIITSENLPIEDFDCILVLGCKIHDSGQPSHMLRDRLMRSVELYNLGASDKILLSGDHGQIDYNEVQAMKQYAIDADIPSEDVFMDHAGFSTYESLYRAKEVFGVNKIVVVTQEYHLYRTLYMAEKLGLEAYGVASDYNTYYGQTMRDIREVLARAKDYIQVMIKPQPTYLGEQINIHGDGNVTND